MKTPTILATVTLSGALLFGASQQSQAQTPVQIDAGKAEFDALQSPQVGGNTNKKKWTPQDWLEFEVEVEVEAAGKEPKDGHIDSLSITWYVAVDNKNREKRSDPAMLLLKKTITHVNVPLGEKIFLSAYLSPASVKRITQGGRADKSAVRAVGGEINCPGAKQAVRFVSLGTTKNPFWTSDKVEDSNRFPLLSKDETPFKFLWWDRYLEIRPATK